MEAKEINGTESDHIKLILIFFKDIYHYYTITGI